MLVPTTYVSKAGLAKPNVPIRPPKIQKDSLHGPLPPVPLGYLLQRHLGDTTLGCGPLPVFSGRFSAAFSASVPSLRAAEAALGVVGGEGPQ